MYRYFCAEIISAVTILLLFFSKILRDFMRLEMIGKSRHCKILCNMLKIVYFSFDSSMNIAYENNNIQ